MTFLLAAVGDPGRTRAVIVSIALLIVLGVGLVVLAMWLLRTTRSDPGRFRRRKDASINTAQDDDGREQGP